MTRITKNIHRDAIAPGEYLLVGDIGGTNSNFAVVKFANGSPQLLLTLNAQSQEVATYQELVQEICDLLAREYAITVRSACFGVAGVIQDHMQCVDPTNLDVTLDAHALKEATPIETITLINDFEAVGTGVQHVAAEDIVTVVSGDGLPGASRAAMGAGTGLGKVGMLWHEASRHYLPVASEGGHSDFPVTSELEMALTRYVQTEKADDAPVSWEDILSGRGIRRIYQFLGATYAYPDTAIAREIASSDFDPDKISEYADRDAQAQATFSLYAQWSGRCAKNWILDMAAFDGLYIAGGIAGQNVSVFQSNAFCKALYASDVHQRFLRNTPVYVVTDYYVNLYGAAVYHRLQQDNLM